MLALSPETSKLLGVTTSRWLWAVDCHVYHPTLVAVRCEQMILNGAWRLPRVFA